MALTSKYLQVHLFLSVYDLDSILGKGPFQRHAKAKEGQLMDDDGYGDWLFIVDLFWWLQDSSRKQDDVFVDDTF